MNQMAKGLGDKASELRTEAHKQLERLKWFLSVAWQCLQGTASDWRPGYGFG